MGLIVDILFLAGEIAMSAAKQRRDNRLARAERREAEEVVSRIAAWATLNGPGSLSVLCLTIFRGRDYSGGTLAPEGDAVHPVHQGEGEQGYTERDCQLRRAVELSEGSCHRAEDSPRPHLQPVH